MAIDTGVMLATRREGNRPCPYTRYAEIHRALRGKMKAKALAQMARIAPSVITSIEKGEQRPSRDYLERAAPVFDVDVFWLMEQFGYVVPEGGGPRLSHDTLTALRVTLLAEPRINPASVPVVESLVRLLMGQDEEPPAE